MSIETLLFLKHKSLAVSVTEKVFFDEPKDGFEWRVKLSFFIGTKVRKSLRAVLRFTMLRLPINQALR